MYGAVIAITHMPRRPRLDIAMKLYRYIGLNLVRAAMVNVPECYPWSSAGANLGISIESSVTPHAVYTAFAPTTQREAQAYRERLRSAVADEDLAAIASTSSRNALSAARDSRRWQPELSTAR